MSFTILKNTTTKPITINMKPFETTGETAAKHLTIALLIIAFMFSALLAFIILHIEQDHKITITQTYNN